MRGSDILFVAFMGLILLFLLYVLFLPMFATLKMKWIKKFRYKNMTRLDKFVFDYHYAESWVHRVDYLENINNCRYNYLELCKEYVNRINDKFKDLLRLYDKENIPYLNLMMLYETYLVEDNLNRLYLLNKNLDNMLKETLKIISTKQAYIEASEINETLQSLQNKLRMCNVDNRVYNNINKYYQQGLISLSDVKNIIPIIDNSMTLNKSRTYIHTLILKENINEESK